MWFPLRPHAVTGSGCLRLQNAEIWCLKRAKLTAQRRAELRVRCRPPPPVRRLPLPASNCPGSSRPFKLITAGWFLRHIQVTVTEKGEREGG